MVALASISLNSLAFSKKGGIIPWQIKNKRVKAMKKGIHPEYHEINVTMTDGKTVKMYSSVKKDLVLSTDNLNHSAWTGQRSNTGEKGRRTESFKKKYAGFGF